MVTTSFDTKCNELEDALNVVRGVVHEMRPGAMSGAQAMAFARCLGEIEKTASSGLALLSPRVIETGVYSSDGHASAPDWLGALTGTSAGVAKGRLAAAERAAEVPELCEALRDGALSAPELSLVAKAGAAEPGAVPTLLEMVAEMASPQELAAEAEAAKAAARDQGERSGPAPTGPRRAPPALAPVRERRHPGRVLL